MVINGEMVEVMRELSFWLRFNAIVFPILALPMIGMVFSQWYMTKRLFELHTTEVDRSGFGTRPLLQACEALKEAVTVQTKLCNQCMRMLSEINRNEEEVA